MVFVSPFPSSVEACCLGPVPTLHDRLACRPDGTCGLVCRPPGGFFAVLVVGLPSPHAEPLPCEGACAVARAKVATIEARLIDLWITGAWEALSDARPAGRGPAAYVQSSGCLFKER